MQPAKACTHIYDSPNLEVLWTLDAYLQVADAYVACGECDARYLIEMVDLKDQRCAYRMAAVPIEFVDKTIKSLRKGSCDINRARNEAASLASLATRVPGLLVMDQGEFVELAALDGEVSLPSGSWRNLPCDGSWLERAGY